jgi:hypothetical protein
MTLGVVDASGMSLFVYKELEFGELQNISCMDRSSYTLDYAGPKYAPVPKQTVDREAGRFNRNRFHSNSLYTLSTR